MKILFTASVPHRDEFLAYYQRITNFLTKKGHQLVNSENTLNLPLEKIYKQRNKEIEL